MFYEFAKQIASIVIGQPLAEVFTVQCVGGTDKFQQLTQAARQQTALTTGKQ
ncbi:hypothetical protein PLA106_14566 [Pseudomonas amygdali pv. lachrymans str. M302278]|nr:hypothetical protein PLA106_14566 [Pseudomonas amygdali pv. lachrymans str. M302278]